MGFDITSLNALFITLEYIKNKNRVLTLGRQRIDLSYEVCKSIAEKNNISLGIDRYSLEIDKYCEKLLYSFDFNIVNSIDNSKYENATIIHNMNLPFLSDIKYDFIIDSGTIEHIYNIPQVFENIIEMLNIDGIYLSIVPNNNFSGHGFYQFSPELFYRTFTKKYGMEIINIYLAKNHTLFNEWIKIEMPTKKINRMEYNFKTNDQVYIIVIAKKISENRKKITEEYPIQFSYEEVEWNI